MLTSRRSEMATAAMFMAPFVIFYGVLFVVPTVKMVELSFTDAPLIGEGSWVGLKNFYRLQSDRLFSVAIWNTAYFVLLSVVPSTLLGLMVALGVNRLKGWMQSVTLAAFFIPYILPVSVVFRIWNWMLDKDFGVAQALLAPLNGGQNMPILRTTWLFLPTAALVTTWWLIGFNVLLFIAGLRNISSEIYEAAELDGAGRWAQFRRITWPLIWPVTALVLTIQLILQLKIFDQVYLFTLGRQSDPTMVMVQYIYKQAFVNNKGGLADAASLVLFAIVVVLSVLQFQLLRVRSQR